MRIFSAVVAAAFLAGCAVTPEQFARERYNLRDDEVCRARLKVISTGNTSFRTQLNDELSRRQIDPLDCPQIVQNASNKAAGAAALAILGAALVAVAKSGGGGGYSPYTPYTPYVVTDFDWAWDQFYNEHSQLVWACRGKQTGQFAVLERCNFKSKDDSTWPSKRADLR